MSEEGTTYGVRLRHRAQRDVNEAIMRLAELTNATQAVAWYSGLESAFGTLATLPSRRPIADENRFFRDAVRVMLYRHGYGSVICRIFFTVVESEDDAPYVYILHVRHAARKPMTRAEARKIETDS